ncbi:hypothetical protein CHU98_g2570 [Xylaria longipes]|nr:hypothetical protein CHU98_g2570 [Xylaria longipes]
MREVSLIGSTSETKLAGGDAPSGVSLGVPSPGQSKRQLEDGGQAVKDYAPAYNNGQRADQPIPSAVPELCRHACLTRLARQLQPSPILTLALALALTTTVMRKPESPAREGWICAPVGLNSTGALGRQSTMTQFVQTAIAKPRAVACFRR